MIDIQLLESAKIIRKDFLSLNNSLNKYQDDVRKLAEFLFKKVDEIKEYNETIKNIKTKNDINTVSKHILTEIESIELEEKKLRNKVNKINEELEKLQKDEEVLYKTIKDRYPKLNDDDIIKEIHQHLVR
jgi:chromosome segregation ATPase